MRYHIASTVTSPTYSVEYYSLELSGDASFTDQDIFDFIDFLQNKNKALGDNVITYFANGVDVPLPP